MHRHAAALTLALLATISAGVSRASAQTASAKGEHKVTDTFKKPSDGELKQKLSPMQYKVTQHEGTEPPFQNEFWNNNEDGIYVDVVSCETLFSCRDKY